MAIERIPYEVVQKLESFEIRAYARLRVAEIEVHGPREEAGRAGFKALVKYFYGKNRGIRKIRMTAPFLLSHGAAPTAAPGAVEGDVALWRIQFMIPSAFTLDSLPTPADPKIALRELPPRRVAALRYRGPWSSDRYFERLATLLQAIRRADLQPVGGPTWARYNPPSTPTLLRTNDILIELRSG
jgi:hypothetical protein